VQVETLEPVAKSASSQRSNSRYDKLHPSFAFDCKLRPCTEGLEWPVGCAEDFTCWAHRRPLMVCLQRCMPADRTEEQEAAAARAEAAAEAKAWAAAIEEEDKEAVEGEDEEGEEEHEEGMELAAMTSSWQRPEVEEEDEGTELAAMTLMRRPHAEEGEELVAERVLWQNQSLPMERPRELSSARVPPTDRDGSGGGGGRGVGGEQSAGAGGGVGGAQRHAREEAEDTEHCVTAAAAPAPAEAASERAIAWPITNGEQHVLQWETDLLTTLGADMNAFSASSVVGQTVVDTAVGTD